MDWRSVVRGHSRIGRPSIKTESSGASHKRAMRAASVVLPLPVGPTIASVVPAGAFQLILGSTAGGARPLDFDTTVGPGPGRRGGEEKEGWREEGLPRGVGASGGFVGWSVV